jgi:hypothetical protein
MNCDHAMQLWEYSRPGATELDAADIAALESHLASCSTCSTLTRAQRAIDEEIATSLRGPEPRDGALERLWQRMGRHRCRWYMQKAFAVFLIVSVAMGVYAAWPGTKLNIDNLAAVSMDQVGNRDAAGEWLASIDRRFQFPPRLRSHHLVRYEMGTIRGRSAPILTFVSGNAIARVAVVTTHQFGDLQFAADGRAAENSSCTILIFHDSEHPEVIYVIEVINGPAEPFLTNDASAVT